jgi:probable phosphoglycerate mutase
MMADRQVFIFRHGETDWNIEGRFQGHLNIPLNAHGREQARALGEKLRGQGLEAILSSDLSRAEETAKIIARILGEIPVLSDSRLREAHLGGAQGLTREEIEKVHGVEILNRWKSIAPSDADVRYPGGESGAEVMSRVFQSLEHFIQTTSYVRFGVASHGGVIRRVMQKINGESQKKVPIPNGVVYKLLWNPQSGWSTT